MDIEEAKEILGERYAFSVEDTQKVIQALKLPKNARILDVGTGLGSLAITLALNGYRVLTGEPKDDETIYAHQDWRGSAEKVMVDHLIEFEPFNAENLPYEDASFDAVFSLGSFHHIEESARTKVLREFVRKVKPNGIICIWEPNKKAVDMIRQRDKTHPDAADPIPYTEGLGLTSRKIEGRNFDAFIFQKRRRSLRGQPDNTEQKSASTSK